MRCDRCETGEMGTHRECLECPVLNLPKSLDFGGWTKEKIDSVLERMSIEDPEWDQLVEDCFEYPALGRYVYPMPGNPKGVKAPREKIGKALRRLRKRGFVR